ncbi:MAG: hypothetical protein JST30_11940 [Armatimonadetes bacterium]|nr:hypothetical protein [Armatimonadota bacterium]
MAKNLTILLIGFAAGYISASLIDRAGQAGSADSPDSIRDSIDERLKSLEMSYESA